MYEPAGASNYVYGGREMGAKAEDQREESSHYPGRNVGQGRKRRRGGNRQGLKIRYILTRQGGGGTM